MSESNGNTIDGDVEQIADTPSSSRTTTGTQDERIDRNLTRQDEQSASPSCSTIDTVHPLNVFGEEDGAFYVKEEPTSPSVLQAHTTDDFFTEENAAFNEHSADSTANAEPLSPSRTIGHVSSEDTQTSETAFKNTSPIDTTSTSAIKTAKVSPLLTDGSRQNARVESPQPPASSSSVPPKPLTPYMRYRNMLWEELKHDHPGCTPYDLATFISGKWSMLTDAERRIWECEYEQDMREYNQALKSCYANASLKREFSQRNQQNKSAEATSKQQNVPPAEERVSRIGRHTSNDRITCNWCKHAGPIQDFTSTIDGQEIYCSGLCSEKCFREASKQICSMESGTMKTRYVSDKNLPTKSPPPSSSRNPSPAPGSTARTASPNVLPADSSSTTSHLATSQPIESIHHQSSASLYESFDWAQYLIKTGATAAPWMYFKQARFAPPNELTLGMKLEVVEPNGGVGGAFVLATVAQTIGCRMRLVIDSVEPPSIDLQRFSRDMAGIWRLPDSADIHPVGWCEANGRQLQMPTAIRKFLSGSPEEQDERRQTFLSERLKNGELAQLKHFRPDPIAPKECYFGVGMKLEAVYKSEPHVIGVATVTEIREGGQLRIEFDGYHGDGYWTHYLDRDLFPASWCAQTRHPLRAPGAKAFENIRHAHDALKLNSRSVDSAAVGCQSSTLTNRLHTTIFNHVEVFMNRACDSGPYLEATKVAGMLQASYQGNIVAVLQTILQTLITCAHDSKTVLGFLKPGRGNCVITAICDGVTYKCCLNPIDRTSTFWNVLEQFADNLRCCPNLFASSPSSSAECERCGRTDRPTQLEVATSTSTSTQNSIMSSPMEESTPPSKRPKQDQTSPLAVTSSPKRWNVDEVVDFIGTTDLKEYADEFKQNEIDGRALLLLKREMIMSCMNMKLGPAIKLLEIIDELKLLPNT